MNKLPKHIIGIHGVPRSGTSWLAQIINSDPRVLFKFQPLFSYGLKDQLDDLSNLEDINAFYKDMISSDDIFLNMKDPEIHRNYPEFKKYNDLDVLVFKQVHHHFILENLLSKDKNLKLILVVRNPFGVLKSWANAPREFYPNWNFNEEWKTATKKNDNKRENYFGYQKWKEATLLFIKLKEQFKDRVYILNYTELVRDTENKVNEVFNFIGLPKLDAQTIEFLNASQKRNDNDPNSVFKKKIDDSGWKSFIPPHIRKEILEDSQFKMIQEKFKWDVSVL